MVKMAARRTRCAECGRKVVAAGLCTWCGAPLTGVPAAIAADGPAAQMPEAMLADAKRSRALQAGLWAMMVGGAALSAFCAYAIVLNVHAFLTQGTPAEVGINYLTPATLAGNIVIWGVGCLVGFAAAIWGFRRRRRSRAD
jgi:hypothetical protein